MYSLLIAVMVLVGIHLSYKHLERRAAFVPNVIHSQSNAHYDAVVSDLPKGDVTIDEANNAPNEDDIERKEELDLFLEELKHTPHSQSNATTIS